MMVRRALAVLTALWVALLPLPAGAAQWDTKHYHGSLCQPNNDEDDLYRWYTTGTRNKGESRFAHLICPIVRDNTTNTNGALVRVTVREVDRGGWCSLHAMAWPDPSTVISAWGAWEGGGIKIVELQLHSSFKHGHYSLWCTISEGSSVISYWVAERLPSDANN
ncbi:MAG: hypothetical protein OXU20_27210 [Myxococcales bacterium]|nr:hypothetical protein [Myxococcales bacterium]MDD9966047.1 hypothetical protein [Myxococcales bacterium]